jgi:hypothetical protein
MSRNFNCLKNFRQNISWTGKIVPVSVLVCEFTRKICRARFPIFSFKSVADPGCLSRIPDPDFYPSRITDPGSRIQKQQQKREVKKN